MKEGAGGSLLPFMSPQIPSSASCHTSIFSLIIKDRVCEATQYLFGYNPAELTLFFNRKMFTLSFLMKGTSNHSFKAFQGECKNFKAD